MEFVWVMTVCVGVSGWGCGMFHRVPQPSYEVCSTEKARFKLHTNAELSSEEDGQAAYVVCEALDARKAPPHPKSWQFK